MHKYNIQFGKPLIGKEEKFEVNKTLNSPILVHGSKIKIFEKKFSEYCKSKFAISVSSCTAGLHLLYFSLNITKGDEVIVSSQTHTATAHAIELSGAKPVFIDSEDESGNIDVNLIEKKITKKTKAICVVHYLGIPCDILKVKKICKKYKLSLIEDCALAVGAKVNNQHVGTFGDAGVFSFYPVKHMTTAEGGMIITNKKSLSNKLLLNRAFGVDRDHTNRKYPGQYDVKQLGFNYRMSEINATIGIVQLKKISNFLKKRKQNFLYLKKHLKANTHLKIVDTKYKNFSNSFYCCCFVLSKEIQSKRNEINLFLKKLGIGTSVYYPHPVPLMSYYKNKYSYNKNNFLNASIFSYNSIFLPVGPHLNIEHMKIIVKELNKIIEFYEK